MISACFEVKERQEKGYLLIFKVPERLKNYILSMIAQLCKYTEKHGIVYFIS